MSCNKYCVLSIFNFCLCELQQQAQQAKRVQHAQQPQQAQQVQHAQQLRRVP